MSAVTIRFATPDDIDALVNLRARFRDLSVPREGSA
jgi:hypothetical protein